jgi:hexosaminidase
MMRVLKIVGSILVVIAVVSAVAWFGFLRPEPPPISPEDRAVLTLMPLPAALRLEDGLLVLDADVSHQFRGSSTRRLERAVRRFYAKLSTTTGVRFGNGDEPRLILEWGGGAADYPALGDDESFSIEVSDREMLVRAPAETGIIYGLETLVQLVREEQDRWVVPQLSLHDRPRYPWRGVLIDVGRHWIPKDVILRNLDAMASVKLNVLHWHLTEYQGFRVESKVFPALHERGSNGHYYTQDDVRDVIAYAADRGIRIVPEFDLPGHATSWFVGYPELASAPGPYLLDSVFGVLEPVMDPTREEVYAFLDRFFGEMAELFPDRYVHIGGDEVVGDQWEENARIRRFMAERDLEDAHALQTYFNIRLQRILEKHGKRMMGWDEILHPKLPPQDVVVQTWRNHSSLWESARSGYGAILSAGYYLDYKQPAGYHYRVDPAVIPGAVTIEIDSTDWKGWRCTLTLSDMDIDGAIYLFGEGEDLRGVTQFMEGSAGFTDAVLEGDRLTFSTESNFGTVKFDARITGDSIRGTARLSFFTLQLRGARSGGSDMEAGGRLPEFTRIDPLTEEQATRLLGGEACMWTEMVDATTLESRVWPRAAAIAEKLWSPQTLTDDTGDMYRRLMILDDRLHDLGLRHRSYRESLLSDMASEEYLHALRTLVDLLEEDKFFFFNDTATTEIYTTTPLNRVVDAAPPESYVAYRFAQDVDSWIASRDTALRERLEQILRTWTANHERLAPAFAQSARLQEIEPHSVHLAELASLALEALAGRRAQLQQDSTLLALFADAESPYGGTILPVVGPIRNLVTQAIPE